MQASSVGKVSINSRSVIMSEKIAGIQQSVKCRILAKDFTLNCNISPSVEKRSVLRLLFATMLMSSSSASPLISQSDYSPELSIPSKWLFVMTSYSVRVAKGRD